MIDNCDWATNILKEDDLYNEKHQTKTLRTEIKRLHLEFI